MLLYIIAFSALIIVALNFIAFRHRRNSRAKGVLSISKISNEFFPDIAQEEFSSTWPKFCDVAGTPMAYQHLDEKITILEKYHPLSDFLYDNIEEFISDTNVDIAELSVRELFYRFHQHSCSQ